MFEFEKEFKKPFFCDVNHLSGIFDEVPNPSNTVVEEESCSSNHKSNSVFII